MKQIYILRTYVLNGTVTMKSIEDIFFSKELAEKCQKKLDEKNKQYSKDGWQIHSEIKEGKLYETEDDCEILKENQ